MKLTWVKEDDGFKASVLIVIDLDVPQGLHQLVQDPGGHTSNFQLRAVHGDDEVIPWGDEKSRFGQLLQLCRHGLTQKPPRPLLPGIPTAHAQQISSMQLHAQIDGEASHGCDSLVLNYLFCTCWCSHTIHKACSIFCSDLPSVIPSICLEVVLCLYFWCIFLNNILPPTLALTRCCQGQYSPFPKNNPICIFGGRELHEKATYSHYHF